MPVPPAEPIADVSALDPFLLLSPDAVVVVGRGGRIDRINARAADLFGWSPDDLVGQPIEALVPAELHEVHRRQRDGFLSAPHTRPMGAGLSLEAARRDGTTFPVDISLSVLPTVDGSPVVIAVVRDMTEQRQRDRAAARLAALVRSSDAAMLSATAQRRIDSWNPAAEVLLGYGPAEIVGHDALELVPDRLRDETQELYERVRNGEGVTLFDTARRHRDGSEVPVAITVSAMRDPLGAFLGWCEVVRDQSERLRIQARLAAAETDRQVLADRERIARDLHDLVIQRIFAAGMGLQALATTIDPDDPAAARVTKAIGELDMAVREIRTSIFTIRRKPGDVASLRARLLDIGTEMTEALGHRPTFDFRGPVDIVVTDDISEAAAAVVREGLANIAKHAQAREARVRVHADAGALRVAVSDDGIGIDETGHRSGLANIAARAEELGGTCTIDTAAGTGTTITWSVPIR
ncbi:MAG: PAS domain-containing sensor histidine kinase [Jatrophihabitans sp.]|uniref:PAS domain-containing sensor histidine kinase n=1 Tax=Jatrophihabitans sp. TaxID=1932789 RepID=UPI003F80AB96